MTTSSTFRNKAIVVGGIDTVLNRKRKVTLPDTYRTLISGQKHCIAVQLLTTEGEPFALELEVHPGIPGYDLLAGVAPETYLAFEGAVRLFTRYAEGYAEGDDIEGALSCWMLSQSGDIVKRTLATRRAEHQMALAATADQEQRRALTRQYRRDVRQLTLQARLLVMVSFVEAADATSRPISYQAAVELRRAQAKRRRMAKAAQNR